MFLTNKQKKVLLIFNIIFTILVSFNVCYSTEEYANKTGNECKSCHIDPSGGSSLTEMGKGYFLSLSVPG
ncbi:MAG: hypothetical protein HY934_01040 [Candidatus Firestonebacteria bacterium]|nr:hypothetical protein [Candidatus Firestonebacteria bacterium]